VARKDARKEMRKQIRNSLRTIRDAYCYADFFLNRGLGLFNSIYQIAKYTAFAGIIVEMINKAFNTQIPMDKVIFFMPILVITLILGGIIDVKKIRALQKTNEITTTYNPFLVKLIKESKNNNEK